MPFYTIRYVLQWHNVVLCTTGINNEGEKKEVLRICNICGFFITNVFSSSVTHVITPATNDATIKILHALVKGLPIITIKW